MLCSECKLDGRIFSDGLWESGLFVLFSDGSVHSQQEWSFVFSAANKLLWWSCHFHGGFMTLGNLNKTLLLRRDHALSSISS